ncbi:MAG: ABC transporter permease subunit [Eubacteriales bacterium]|nr:ABC transporter permease subunit [Eubacteriales bacterium]
MRSFFAFLNKEWMELVRTGRMLILLLIFALFGIMNPAIAKITPWLMETMADSLESTGLSVSAVTVDAMTSWTQFYKNIPMALLIFVLLWSGSFSREHQKGTLIAVVTKGFARWKIVAAKSIMIVLSWTVCYWLCFGITYVYNMYFWDNGIAQHCLFAAVCCWMFGLWTVGFMVMFSAFTSTNTAVLSGTGGALLAFYLLGFLPKAGANTPMKLMQSMPILMGLAEPEQYTAPITAAVGIIGICLAAAVMAFQKKRI